MSLIKGFVIGFITVIVMVGIAGGVVYLIFPRAADDIVIACNEIGGTMQWIEGSTTVGSTGSTTATVYVPVCK